MAPLTRAAAKGAVTDGDNYMSSKREKTLTSDEKGGLGKTKKLVKFKKTPNNSGKDKEKRGSNGKKHRSTRSVKARPNAVPAPKAKRATKAQLRSLAEAADEYARTKIRTHAKELCRLSLDLLQKIYVDLFRSCDNHVLFRQSPDKSRNKFVLHTPASHYLKPEYVGDQIFGETWDVLSSAAFYQATWINLKVEEVSTFLQGRFPVLRQHSPAAVVRNIEIDLKLDSWYAAGGWDHQLLNEADWIDVSPDFPLGEIELSTRYNIQDRVCVPGDNENNSAKHTWLMGRYVPRAQRAGFLQLLKLPRLERVAFHVYTYPDIQISDTKSLSGLIPIVRHLRDRGVEVTVFQDGSRSFPRKHLDLTRRFDCPSEEDEKHAVAHSSGGNTNRHGARSTSMKIFVGQECACESCARVSAERLYNSLKAQVELQRQDSKHSKPRPVEHFMAIEKKHIESIQSTTAGKPAFDQPYLISPLDCAAEWELEVEELVTAMQED